MKRLTGKICKLDRSEMKRPGLFWQKGGWAVEISDGKYYFLYPTSEMAGRLINEEISKAEFDGVINGELTAEYMLKKYGKGHG
ncbi:hypothetical protein [Microbulbifer epialgicus]|uniref:Uncharacterized protein n=1 Tax=Microbulbifer epialgicus TaxID=393907 RepID=A0ABV4P5H9_9GAMM